LAAGFATVATEVALPVVVVAAPPCANAGAVSMVAAMSAVAIFLNMILNLSEFVPAPLYPGRLPIGPSDLSVIVEGRG
jgi:hypothetical protein